MSGSEGRPVRVLIVEDQALVRQGLRTILDLEEGIQVVGEAADGVEALERISHVLPAVALTTPFLLSWKGVGRIEAAHSP